jgi:hypothetical protein
MTKIKTTAVAALAVVLSFTAAAAQDSGKVITIGSHSAGNVIPWRGATCSSMRFQCLWLKSAINTAGYVNVIEFEKTNAAIGQFSNVRVWLCHSTKTGLETTFNNNYTGKTPVQVRTGGNLNLYGSGYSDIGITPNKFNYNNSDNLLMEVRWSGDNGVDVSCWLYAPTYAGRIWSPDDEATTGITQTNTQCIRLHINTMSGVAPTSLGRVRALFW